MSDTNEGNAMKTVEIKGHLYARENWNGNLQYTFFDFNPESDWFMVCEHTARIDVPEGFDPRLAKIQALQKRLEKARADFSVLQQSILDQISKVQAIEYKPAEEPIIDSDDFPF